MQYGRAMQITSSSNEKIKLIKRLRNRRDRDQTNLFLIEGYRELKRALDAEKTIDHFFYSPSLFLQNHEKELLRKAEKKGAKLYEIPQDLFEKISYRDRPDGLLAIAPKLTASLEDIRNKLSKNPFLVIAESIEKPGNLGTILRSSDAAGVDGVIVCDPCTDIHNPNVVRASVGTLFTLPVVEVSKRETLCFLKEQQISVCSSTPKADSIYTEANLTGPIAILVGCEQYGLSKEWIESADIRVKIPMCGVADSLNVAQATTLLLYEALRQRR